MQIALLNHKLHTLITVTDANIVVDRLFQIYTSFLKPRPIQNALSKYKIIVVKLYKTCAELNNRSE